MRLSSGLIGLWALALLALVLADTASVEQEEKLGQAECAAQGFNSLVLTCDVCAQMHKVLSSADALAACLSCCADSERYASAVLQVDRRYLPFNPSLSEVVSKRAELGLRVRYRNGSPALHMYREDEEEIAESVGVSAWDLATFRDYLQAHLTPEALALALGAQGTLGAGAGAGGGSEKTDSHESPESLATSKAEDSKDSKGKSAKESKVSQESKEAEKGKGKERRSKK
ncbi:hypothetical protein B484DRAFT_100577 [Ochromonadaceae sp. CCMP2298]|nr:hypothetical protein B484DRAFT_100577 [Ochromonadaceae sp. CCMP2298]